MTVDRLSFFYYNNIKKKLRNLELPYSLRGEREAGFRLISIIFSRVFRRCLKGRVKVILFPLYTMWTNRKEKKKGEIL